MKPRIVIQFLVTAKEKRAIQRAAKRAGLSVSEWLRRTANNEIPRLRAAMRRLSTTYAVAGNDIYELKS